LNSIVTLETQTGQGDPVMLEAFIGLKPMLLNVLRLLRDDRGATKVEHMLITLLVAWAALQIYSFVGEKVSTW
jgi:Flp pilus assembly pilin Flp